MRKMITAAVVMVAMFILAAPSVMAGNGSGSNEGGPFEFFYNWLRDSDGDGIPNCLDPDYVRPQDGTGFGKLGPRLYTDCSGDQLRDGDQVQDRDQLKDGSCDGDATPNEYSYKNYYLWKGARK